MSEPGKDIEPREPKAVALSGNRKGHEFKTVGDVFPLSNMFSELAGQLGGDKFDKVYFRTDSGNIYLLSDDAELLNGKESGKKGAINTHDLDPEVLEHKSLVIGEPFLYGSDGRTTTVVEIVPTNDRVYMPDALKNLPANNIVKEFNALTQGKTP